MIDWLLTPLSGAPEHVIASWAYWHARWMVLAWGLLLPAGALVARFFKITPSQQWPREVDNRMWWHLHRALQYGGIGLMTLGALSAWDHGSRGTALARWHAIAGWVLCGAGWAQILGALTRGSKGGPTEPEVRGDHYDMTPWRRSFERLHKGVGWAAVAASVGVIVSGLVVADSPRWMIIVLVGWWLVFTAAFALLQARGRCVDTYQAIWGPDPRHPGNAMRPIGWGVQRPFEGGQR